MRTLDRFLTVLFLKNFAVATAALVALFQFQALLSEIFSRVYPIGQVLKYHWLNTPAVMVQLMPPGVLLATVLSLSTLSRTNELIACYSIGVGLRRITALFLSLVFMISCMMLVLQDRICPPVYKKRTSYKIREMEKRNDFFLDIKQDKIWYRSKNFIYNLKRFDVPTKTIYGMAVYEFDSQFNLEKTIEAVRAEFTPEGWKLADGTITTYPASEPFPVSQAFKNEVLKISETPKDFLEIEKEVNGLRLKELFQYTKRMAATGADTKGMEVTFHSRISLSLIPVVMCFLGIPFTLRSRREGGVARDLGVCLGLTFCYWLFYSLGLSLGTNGALPPVVAAWTPSAIFACLAVFLIWRARKR